MRYVCVVLVTPAVFPWGPLEKNSAPADPRLDSVKMSLYEYESKISMLFREPLL